MEEWFLSFLLIAGTSGSQLRRHRVSLVHQVSPQEAGAAAVGVGGHEPPQPGSPFPLLPWALVVLLGLSFALYVHFSKEQEGGEATSGSVPETTVEEELLGEILGVLSILQDRLWQMVRETKKRQRLLHSDKGKVC